MHFKNSSTGEAGKKDAKTSHGLGDAGTVVGNGKSTEGVRGGSPRIYITILAHFPSENQSQLKHQIKENKKKEMKEKQNIDFSFKS